MRTLIIKIAIMVVRYSLPELERQAKETKNPLDDIAVQIAKEILSAYDRGEIKFPN